MEPQTALLATLIVSHLAQVVRNEIHAKKNGSASLNGELKRAFHAHNQDDAVRHEQLIAAIRENTKSLERIERQ